MKIGIVCYPSYGGSGVVATELGVKLAKRGHEIHFISHERPFKLNHFYENIFLHEVDILEYPLFKFPPYSIALAGKIAEVVRYANLDLVHVHYAIPHSISAYLARQMVKERYVPFITTLHGTDITLVGNDEQFLNITKFSIEESDGVTAVSQSLTAETKALFNVDKAIETVYNFIDTDEYARAFNTNLHSHFSPNGEKILIHISNFRPVKRLVDVVKTFALVNKEIPSRLLLVGDGPDRIAAQHIAEDLGVTDKISFLGKQESVVELLSIADIFLLPSEKESFGLVALEAMACEVPVIATRTGGIPEVVKDGETGFLADIGDVNTMARSIVQLLKDPELHQRFAKAARQRAEEEFEAKLIVDQYENYYREICNK